MKYYIIDKIKNNRFLKNISWIFFGNLTHSILSFLLNIFIARKFSTNDYGIMNYSTSLIAFFITLGTLGFDSTITKKFAENEDNCGEYLGSTITIRCIYSVFSIFILQIIVRALNCDDRLLHTISLVQSFTILFNAFNSIVYWFRYKYEANFVAIARLVAFGLSALWRIFAIVFSDDIVIYVIGTSIETALFAFLLLIMYKRKYNYKMKFSFPILKDMIKISYPFICSAILSTVYAQTDKIMLKNMLDNTAVALYSVSSLLANAAAIIPTTIIEGFRPDIMKYKYSNEVMYLKRLRQLYAIIFWVSIMYCVFITIFAKQIILIVYGTKYLDAVSSLSLIVWYTAFSYFGAINSLYMVAENKTKWVQIITLSGAVINVLLNYILIPIWGIIGAATASLVTQFVANFILIAIIKPLRSNFKVMIKGIMLKNIN